MTYSAEVQFKFDATWEPTYGTSSLTDDDILPEEHYLITSPAGDLNCKQYFKLFEKFLFCVGMDPVSIRSGAMSLVFNDWVREEDQRKVCEEYDLTMNEDLRDKFKEWKEAEEEYARLERGPMGTVITEDSLSNDASWEERYWDLKRNAEQKIKELEEEIKKYNCDKVTRLEVIDNAGRSYSNRNVTGINFHLQDDDRTLKLFVD